MKLKKIVFVGAPSTGKSTLSKTLAEKYKTQWVPEFGRYYWEQHQTARRLTQEQLVEIAIGQREWEKKATDSACDFLFVDTEAIVTRQYAFDYFDESSPQLDYYADLSKDRYDYFFLCDTDIPYEENWARSGAVHRQDFQERLIKDLQLRQIDFTVLTGNLAARIHTVDTALSSL